MQLYSFYYYVPDGLHKQIEKPGAVQLPWYRAPVQ